jgi:cell division protein FtsB
MQRIFAIVSNKYILAPLVLLVWVLFFDETDYFTQKDRLDVLQKLYAKKNYYEQEITKAKTDLNNLESNPFAIEKYARETYLMHKDGEVVFLMVEEPSK